MSQDPNRSDPNQREPDAGGGWLDRHLGKLVGGALALCLLGLVGRAVTG